MPHSKKAHMRYTTCLMKIIMRVFAFLFAVSAVVAALLSAQTSDKATTKNNYLVFVGTYTTKTASKGIYVFRYDAISGKLTTIGVAAETQDPSWVAIHPNGRFLYAVNEAGKKSMVSAFSLDAESGRLTLLNQLPALGEDPCYLSFDRTGKYVFVANYTSGNVVVFPIEADGKLGSATANVHDEGALGPNKERQEGPHAHWIANYGSEVLVADLGLDSVLAYDFDKSKGTLAAVPTPGPKRPFVQSAIKLAPGTGPRHIAISSEKRFPMFLYVVGELDSSISVFVTSKEGMFGGSIRKVPMLPAGFSGRNDAAEIAIHPNGRFLYTSNRGHDSIALFHIDSASGKLAADGDFSVEGKEPRHFAIDPSGNFLLAEDQFSDRIVTFRIDQKSGALAPTGDSMEVPSPVCLVFLPVD